MRGFFNVRLLLAAAWVLGGVTTAAHADLFISSAPTNNVNCSGGICVPTAKKAVLNAAELAAMLASGDVTVESGSDAKDIVIGAALGWTSASRLTLDSYRAITFAKTLSVTGTGALTLNTNDGGKGGDLSFVKSGRVTFWDTASSLVINGQSYTLIASLADLIGAVTAEPAGNYALVKNDKARKRPFSKSPMDLTFNGNLEGLGNTIDRLSLSPHKGWAGMISTIGADATVRDLALTNVTIDAYSHQYGGLRDVGALAGISNGTLDNIYVSGTLTTANNYEAMFGLVAGTSNGAVTHVSASGAITVSGTNNSAGGLFGFAGAEIGKPLTWSHAAVNITNTDYTGGLVGWASGYISNCSATGTVSGGLTGGLVGNGEVVVANSYASGNVTGAGGGGGLIGGTDGGDTHIYDSYATGSVASHGFSGGFVGLKVGTFDHIYSIGAVSATGSSPPGGLIGYDDYGTTAAGFWDLDTSGVSNTADGAGNIANDPGITGLSDAALRSGLPSGFDPAVWGQSASINNGYPYLIANPPPQ